MHILFLATDAWGASGGIAQYNRDLTQAMLESPDIEQIIILPRHLAKRTDLPEGIVQVKAVQNRVLYCLRALLLVVRYKPDIVFCGHINLSVVAWLSAKLFRKNWWLQLHGIDAWNKPSKRRQQQITSAQKVLCVSRYTRRRFLSWAKFPPESAKVLPNTLREIFFTREKQPGFLAQHDWANKRLLLTVGRLSATEQYKGHDRVITALAELIQSDPQRYQDLQYVIAGDGDDRPRLEMLSNQLGLNKHVIFLGQIPDKDLAEWYRQAEIFIMPSTHEGFGIVFLEAAACGAKVIAGNVDGSVDALADGELGTLCNPTDLAALQTAIKQALEATDQHPKPDRFRHSQFKRHLVQLISEYS